LGKPQELGVNTIEILSLSGLSELKAWITYFLRDALGFSILDRQKIPVVAA